MMGNIQVSSNCSRSGTREPEYREFFCYSHSCNVQIIWNSGVVYVLYCMQLNYLKGMNGRPLNRKIWGSSWGSVLVSRLKEGTRVKKGNCGITLKNTVLSIDPGKQNLGEYNILHYLETISILWCLLYCSA